ncbi:MAG TPA: hypothetical protein VK213_00465 [Bacteroidales bacterium]|nr:hypothetical protein [Bacteroidales bacterium]
MDKSKNKNTKEHKSDAKATRLKRIREGNKKTSNLREKNSDTLFGERQVK